MTYKKVKKHTTYNFCLLKIKGNFPILLENNCATLDFANLPHWNKNSGWIPLRSGAFPVLISLTVIVVSFIEKGCECGVLFSAAVFNFSSSFPSLIVWTWPPCTSRSLNNMHCNRD